MDRRLAVVSRALVAAGLTAQLAAGLAAQDVPAPARYAKAREVIGRLVADGLTPALSLAVLEDDHLVWAEGFGTADLAAGRAADADTIYRLASISKPFTATALMTLVDQGELDLDAPINQYLQGCAVTAYRGLASDVTLRRLCNHTAGLPTHWNFFPDGQQPPPRPQTIRDFAFCAWPPGTRTNYSNLAFGIVDHVVATAAGGDFAGYLRAAVLDPLGLQHTDLGVRPGKQAHAAVGYVPARDDPPFSPVDPYGFDHDGASAVWSSARDVLQFARLWLHDGEVDGVRVLTAASALAMQTPRAAGAGSSFGVGWSTGRQRGHRCLSHTGGMPGVSTALHVFPDCRRAVVVLTNSSNRVATQGAMTQLLGVLLPDPPAAGSERELLGDDLSRPATTPATPLPAAFSFRGFVGHPDGPLPIELGRDAAGAVHCVIDGHPAAALQVRDDAPGQFVASCRAPLHTTAGPTARPQLDLELLHEPDGGLRGLLYATADGACRLPFWVELQPAADRPPDGGLRAITWNVLVGWRDAEVGRFLPGAQRRARSLAWLAAQQPDVVALQELNGFTAETLGETARAWGHAHTALLKEDGYPVALTSRAPIEHVERVREALDGSRLHHGMLHAQTLGVHFAVVHLRPHAGVEIKLRESARAAACVAAALSAGAPAVVLGDFNCVAEEDVDRYGDAARDRYRRWQWPLDDGRPLEFALQPLRDGGMIEAVSAGGSLPATMSLPRVDFVFLSPDLAARCAQARWLDDPQLLRCSDHPPVVVDFGLDRGR